MSETNDRVVVPFNDAVAMLPDGDHIHTFRNSAFMLIGADWDRAEVIAAIEKHGVELAGDAATSMNHGLVLNDGKSLFIETRKQGAENAETN